MLATEVRKWFKDGCHFGTGMTLLARTGANPTAFATLNKFMVPGGYVPDAAKARLQHELKEWVKKQPVASRQSTAALQQVSENATIVQNIDIPKPEPTEIQALRAKAKPLHKKESMLHEAMRHAKTDSERYEIVVERMEVLRPALDAIYDQIRKWEKEGILPDEPGKADVVKETVAKMKRVGVLRPRISRLKKWLEDAKLDAVKRQKFELELVEKELELKRLEKELNL